MLGLGEMDDDDVLDIYRSWLYQEIPLDSFAFLAGSLSVRKR